MEGNNPNTVELEVRDETNDFPQAALAAACNEGMEDPRNAPRHPSIVIAEDDEFDEMNEYSNDEIMDQTKRDEL